MWIHPVGWEKHQHPDTGRTTTPAWIKVHTCLLSDDNYLSLSPHQRAVLHGLWLEYARSRRQLTVNTASISRRLGLRVSSRQLEALNHAGFITFSASKVASLEESRGEESRKDSPSIPLTADQQAAYKILNEGVEKSGYCAPKFSHKRFASLTIQYPTVDLVAEAEKLRDWEMFGGGETATTKDGIARLRNWLARAAAPSTNGHVAAAEVDYPWLPGCEPKR